MYWLFSLTGIGNRNKLSVALSPPVLANSLKPELSGLMFNQLKNSSLSGLDLFKILFLNNGKISS